MCWNYLSNTTCFCYAVSMIFIYDKTGEQYAQAIFQHLGKGYEHALMIYKAWMRKGMIPLNLSAFRNCQSLLKDIVSSTDFSLPRIFNKKMEGEVVKLFIQLHDQKVIESVILPMQFGWSLCVSSQVGCRMGCTFCQTGRMGLIRQLETSEIVSQLYLARQLLGYPIRNIVFMGMGEPFDNFDAVKNAVSIFIDPTGFGLGARHVTLSTSGRIDGIQHMRAEIPFPVNLAVSINAPNDAIRKKLMPINRKYNMAALKQSLKEYTADSNREVLIEYILIKGLTDSFEAADELALYLRELPVKVNLIPYNPQQPTQLQCSEMETIEAFKKRLQAHGLRVLLRTTKGSNLMAACGQLG